MVYGLSFCNEAMLVTYQASRGDRPSKLCQSLETSVYIRFQAENAPGPSETRRMLSELYHALMPSQ